MSLSLNCILKRVIDTLTVGVLPQLPSKHSRLHIIRISGIFYLFFFQFGTYFIVDEVQTGMGGCGHMWQHEQWNLPEPADIVTFSKKALTGGMYMTDEMRPTEVRMDVTSLWSIVMKNCIVIIQG